MAAADGNVEAGSTSRVNRGSGDKGGRVAIYVGRNADTVTT